MVSSGPTTDLRRARNHTPAITINMATAATAATVSNLANSCAINRSVADSTSFGLS